MKRRTFKHRAAQTRKCLVCLAPAESWGGHVVRGREIVIAGFCNAHRNTVKIKFAARTGCFGGYLPEYELERP